MSAMHNSLFWAAAFDATGDINDPIRERLRQALERMRENASLLVSTIPEDCKGLTVHDVSHLDALWEMADLIAGVGWTLNPAEAFVFGGAVLLHDAGMSVAAFPGGLQELTSTEQWRDVAASVLRQNSIDPTDALVAAPPEELQPVIKFEVLRLLHAEQAEKIATASWPLPGGGVVQIIEDQELRTAFGASIGRIAHSHHWPIEKVGDDLLENFGVGTAIPAAWSINEKKVACLLRCADAAHIDRRRAPAILFASKRPIGLSASHWSAQYKLNKANVRDGTLTYSAGQSFSASEAKDWWLAYDLVQLIDREIRNSNALLEEIGEQPFQVTRVLGAESPRALAKYVKPEGWTPVDAEIRVSDPIHLARTLGGASLYGHDALVPVRELLQNAADAIRARRALEEREPSFGRITITVEPSEDEETCWLHIDDDGVGMTERVLAGPLIDFGKSIWNSSILREEFPGLQSKSLKPIGKFGIGFFSVFELANEVRVISKKFDAGLSEAKVLEFATVAERPILRNATRKELPRDASTRVSLRIKNKDTFSGVYEPSDRYAYRKAMKPVSFDRAILRMISMLDVDVDYNDKINALSFSHSWDVYNVPTAVFIEELLPNVPDKLREHLVYAHSSTMSLVTNAEGNAVGRASLMILSDAQSEYERSTYGAVSVGGFVYRRSVGLKAPYIGCVEGDTRRAARDFASTSAQDHDVSQWATDQISKIDKSKFLSGQLMRLCEDVLAIGGDPGGLPYCFNQGRLVSYEEALKEIPSLDIIHIPLSLKYSSSFEMSGYSDLGPHYFDLQVRPSVFVLRKGADRLLEDEMVRLITKMGREEIAITDFAQPPAHLIRFIQAVTQSWGREPRLAVRPHQVFAVDVYSPPPVRWTLAIIRGEKAAG